MRAQSGPQGREGRACEIGAGPPKIGAPTVWGLLEIGALVIKNASDRGARTDFVVVPVDRTRAP